MKKLLIILSIFLTLSMNGFTLTAKGEAEPSSNTTTTANSEEQAEAEARAQAERDKELYASGKIKIDLGFNISPGMSFNSTRITSEGERKFMFAGQASFRTIFYFSDYTGMITDIGIEYYGSKETQGDSYYKKFKLLYGFLSVSYLLKFKDLLIFFGPIVDFPLYGKYEDPVYNYSSLSSFTIPNVGFTFGTGVFVYKSKGFKLYIGFNLKYQFLTYTRIPSAGSKIMAMFLDFSMFF